MGKPYNSDGQSAESKALDQFAEMMIAKIESLNSSDGWKKPWLTDGALSWPKNMTGREYNGMSALLLMMQCEKQGYKIPRFCTFDCVQRMNANLEKDDPARILINKGERSFPVMLTTYTCIDKDTKERIRYDDYKNLTDEEKAQYNVYPKNQVFRVFNVEQTNLKDARPGLWAKFEEENKRPEVNQGELYSFEPMDAMIHDNRWICPIKPTHGDNAYFSISKNEIVIPEKQQFKDGESFYNNLYNEMSHSTGHESALNRIKPASFGRSDYGREELVAELTAALTAQRYGMTKHLKSDSAAYLKSWLDSLHESPQFIKTVLLDVKRSASMITQNIDKIAQELEQKQGKEQSAVNGVSSGIANDKSYYASVAYLQHSDDTRTLDILKDNGDYTRLLQEAKEYDQGDAIDLEHTHKSPIQNRGDDLLTEDSDYAVVYNNSVGGTYEILRRVSEQDIRQAINRYGLPSHPSADIKEIAERMGIDQDQEHPKSQQEHPKSQQEHPKSQQEQPQSQQEQQNDEHK